MNKIFVITGTRKGLGLDLVKHYVNQGHIVIGCSRRTSDFVHENYTHYCIDVSVEVEVKDMINQVYLKYKKIDYLINNAGVASMNHALLTPLVTAKKLIDTNFIGTFLLSRETSKVMMKQKFGRIINFSTVAVPLNLEGELIYSSTKAAVEQLTKVLAAEIGKNGITVNAVGPTPIATDLIKNVPQKKIDELINKQSIHRMGTFQDVLNVINFFLSEDSSFITGQIIYLGGIN